MQAHDCHIAYDIITSGVGAAPIFLCLGIVAGLAICGGILVQTHRGRHTKATVFCYIWISLWLAGGGYLLSAIAREHRQCLQWATSGDFQVTAGVVRNMKPMPYEGHSQETFIVANVMFRYSDYDILRGGFRNTSSHGGPIREGLNVRIAHRDGRILKLEICD